MLYAARYTIEAPTRGEELAHQRALAEKLLAYALKREHGLELSSLAQSRTAAGKPYFPGCPVGVQPQPLPGAGVLCPQPVPCGGGRRGPPHSLSPPCCGASCTQEELSWLTAQQDQQQAFLSLWDPERERDEALRPRHRLWLPAGVLHLPRGPAPLPGARRAPVPVRPGGGHCCLRRRRGGVPKPPAGGARPVIRSYPAVLSHRYTTRTQQRGTVERWSYR